MNNRFLELSVYSPFFQFIILIVVLFFLIVITKKLTKSYVIRNAIEPHRRLLILKFSYFIYYTLTLFIALIIFGINFKEVIVFASSILAVLGVGFFAQWSILSNITAGVLLFFYHPMRIGNTIKILDKDYDFTGEIKNITSFYVVLHIHEGNREITIPNTIILYKSIELLKDEKK
ncbi:MULTISPECIES: mechanosensitive ion channel domain-containing protein [Tenacibaculum]|uniref:mechanosensitive ion channel domain-containing protein n=1 Tax=Tenacibaculum TaxID=104267 RepID=UPI001F0AEF0C|nr:MULTISPECIES: mechanosensitive ion channel family protein [Tenacibaculum]MCH3882067.1 mechanosensitive ion channel family protein [Tenacibaculum aquimarinum]MCH3885089.1 mechanosensitive ion channel family protein [Tenacibaculum aquimarinum]MDO6599708.1 mechanosensitive ion channel family protein [Tenacibaculum sp. 1_MG-2023]